MVLLSVRIVARGSTDCERLVLIAKPPRLVTDLARRMLLFAWKAKGRRNAATFSDRIGARGRAGVRRCRAGSAKGSVQGHRTEQPDAGFDLRRGAVLAE